MPEQTLVNSAIAGATGLLATILALLGFTGKYQTKVACGTAHSEHDKLEVERQKNRDLKLGVILDSIGRVESLVDEIHKDFYGPRLEDTRRNDS